MHAKSTVAVALLSASTLVSAGSAIVNNHCNFPIFLTAVTNVAGEPNKIKPNHHWSQPFQTNPDGGGISVKMSTSPSLYTGAPITQLEYTIDSTLWYDMSNINGNPFMQWGMSLKSSSSACRNVLCAAGVEECDEAYNTPDENENTASCTPDSDLVLDLCSSEMNSAANTVGQAVTGALDVATGNDHKHKHHDNKHHHNKSDHKKHHHNNSDHKKHHNKHHNEPAPAPVSVSAPAISAPAISVPAPASVAAAATTFVTQVVTVTARDAKPSADAHAHANYHRHHFQRRS